MFSWRRRIIKYKNYKIKLKKKKIKKYKILLKIINKKHYNHNIKCLESIYLFI